MHRTVLAFAAAGVLGCATAGTASAQESTRASAVNYTNCTTLHATYPHGVGRTNAVDHVGGKSRPVTTFVHDTKRYNAAVAAKPDLDRDGDGVACEKR